MPSPALVSTWKQVCGIAHYAAFQKEALAPHFDVHVFPLPRAIFSGPEGAAAEAALAEICDALPAFDVTHVHYEPILFGPGPDLAVERASRIFSSARSLSVEFHLIALPPARQPFTAHLEEARRLRGPLRALHRAQRKFREDAKAAREHANRMNRLYGTIGRHARTHPTVAIVHRRRDADLLRTLMPAVTVFDHPLAYLPAGFDIDALAARSALRRILPDDIPSDVRFIGVFGFIAPYKGFDTALRALDHLPPNYHLLMFTSVHSSGLFNQSYAEHILSLAAERGRRVHQTGVVADDDVLVGMMLCDSILFPYRNPGTASSAPASIAIDLNRHVVFSRCNTFLDFAEYEPEVMRWAEIDDPRGFAGQVLTSAAWRRDRMVHGLRFVEFPPLRRDATVEGFAERYRDLLRDQSVQRRTD